MWEIKLKSFQDFLFENKIRDHEKKSKILKFFSSVTVQSLHRKDVLKAKIKNNMSKHLI